MKLAPILLILLFNTDTVKQLNNLARNYEFCNDENQITKWTIDCASDFYINFEKATLIDNATNEYKISGTIYAHNEPLPEIIIRYGKYGSNFCNLEDIGKTDENGKFNISVILNQNKMLSFQMVGFRTISIKLDL